MKFKGDIIVTDPCYIVKKCTEENPYPFPWTTVNSKAPNRDEMIKQYNEWEYTHDDWLRCDYGRNMEALGISTYLTEDTICGDWSCTTYKITENFNEIINNLIEAFETGECYKPKCSQLGNFCADSGLVSVFLLDEVRKYNQNIDKWVEKHDWCATVIPDFDGEVRYYIDKNSEAHIIGIGNINFFTA